MNHELDKITEHSENAERKRRDNGKHQGVIMPVPATSVELPGDYADFLKQIKQRVKAERLKAVLSANAALILMYWDIGHDILRKQEQAGWGAKVIDRLACDLKESFPEMNGFSARNLKYMRKFAEEWPERGIVQRTVAQIPWRSNLRVNEPPALWSTVKYSLTVQICSRFSWFKNCCVYPCLSVVLQS